MVSSNTIYLYDVDQTWIQVVGERALVKELGEYFTYEVPNARFMPSYKDRLWDGKVRLLDYYTQRIYRGLIPYIKIFCQERGYDCVIEDIIKPILSKVEVGQFLNSLKLSITPYPYQVEAIKKCLTDNRLVLLSPTSSGKSLMIYALIRYFLEHTDKKILLCVPTVGLIAQMIQEFKDYAPSFPIEKHIHPIYEGQPKNDPSKRLYISTWQSVYKLEVAYFNQFGSILIDEAHQAKADSIKGILQKANNAAYRFGFTGTLDDLEYHRLIIEGLTGPVHIVTTTKKLMDDGIVSKLQINCLVLKYDEMIRTQNKKFSYQEEVSFIVHHQPRNRFIAKLTSAIASDQNILVLTAYLNHIELLKKELEKTGRKVYVVTGNTDPLEREAIRKIAEKETGIIILATYGVYSTGINIKNLQYIIFATGSKSLIRLLQSIGRGLRLDGKWNLITVLDIVDEFSFKTKKNYLTKHFFERVKIYIDQKFSYKMKNINI